MSGNREQEKGIYLTRERRLWTKALKKGEKVMSKKKGMYITWTGDGDIRHLGRSGRKHFWSRERMAVRRNIQAELLSEMFDFSHDTLRGAVFTETDDNSL